MSEHVNDVNVEKTIENAGPNESNKPIEPIESIEPIEQNESTESNEVAEKEPTIHPEVINELCGTTPEFCTTMHALKYKVYTIIVLQPEDEESNEAQDNQLLQKYIDGLDIIYRSGIEKINNNNTIIADKKTLHANGYSDDAITAINDVINQIHEFVSNHTTINKLAFLEFLNGLCRVYPFSQSSTFPTYE